MKNRLLAVALLICTMGYSCGLQIYSLGQGEKIALRDKKFILAYFSPQRYRYQDKFDLQIHDNPELYTLLSQFVNVNVPVTGSFYRSKYHVSAQPELLVLDANGKEMCRITNFSDTQETIMVLSSFSRNMDFVSAELLNFHNKQTFITAMRAGQKYLDYAMLVDKARRSEIYHVADDYLNDAISHLGKKDPSESLQRIALMKIYRWACDSNFSILREKLAGFAEKSVAESNREYYLFLKYLAAKAFQSDDLSNIESSLSQFPAFDEYRKKADLLLAGT